MSKFQGVLDAHHQGREVATVPVERSPRAQSRRRGRPPGGKRSDPDYEQVTAYIRRSTHHGVKLALLQDGKGQEFSELVERLLSNWLKSRS